MPGHSCPATEPPEGCCVGRGGTHQDRRLRFCPRPGFLGLEAHLISLATHLQLAQDRGVQGEPGRGQAQVLGLRSWPNGLRSPTGQRGALADLQWEVMIPSPLPTTSPGKRV